MRKWIVLGFVILGLIAFAALVWFAFPWIAFGGFAPFESEFTRIMIILVVWLTVGLVYLIRWLLRRRAAKKLEEGLLKSGGEDSDSKVLAERMGKALETLKASTGKSNYLYSLPWYIIIGPPGAGKTTALLKSGLKFPLAGADGGASIAGTGGTRYCDWWFTDEAVLVDTAGRYTTQDSDAQADQKSWLSFLQMLKRNRPKQPINGVIVAISLEDIMKLSPEQIAEHSAAIRKRLIEVHKELRIDFPVYALFTKADLIAGFNEYFGNFTEARRRKVWGHTFQTEDRRKNMIAKVPEEYDALVKRLTEELPDRLQEEPDQISRIAIFGFPAQFAILKDKVFEFLRQIFEPNRYQVNANLRGFYFSSGTQEGTPIDQVLGVLDRSAQGFRQMSGMGKSYFIHDLITKVIFNETGWVSLDMRAIRRSAALRYGLMSIVGLVTAGAIGLWAWSFVNNRELIANTDRFIGEYRVAAAEQLAESSISDFDLMSVLPALELLRNNPVGYEHRAEPIPVSETFGLSQRERLVVSSEASYRTALERFFRSRLILRLERQLEDTINDPMAAYEALKVYMMIGGKAPKVNKEFIVAWMRADWEQNLYPGPNNRAARDALEKHLRAMLDLEVGKRPSFELNGLLVDTAQRTLTRLSIADQAYGYMQSLVPEASIEDFIVSMRTGPESALVFETVDGSPWEELRVPALYTYRGFHEFFLGQLSVIADQLVDEQWVRGELGQGLLDEAALRQLGPQLLSLYSRDFVEAWNRMLNNIRVKTLPGERPDYVILSVFSNPGSSPLKALVEGIVRETQLTAEPPDLSAGLGGDPNALAGELGGDVARFAAQRLEAQATGLSRVGIQFALRKAQGRPGEVQSSSDGQIPGANIEAQFQDYAVLLQGTPRAVDSVVDSFNEVYRNLVISARNPGQSQQATQAVNLNVANLSMSASRFPVALRRMLTAAVQDLEGDAAGTSLAQLNQRLASDVTRLCEQLTSNLYPFANSSRDLPIADFSRLFAPNGVMDRFFAENLASFADLSTDPWTWRQDTALGRDLSNAALREFQRAAEIRDAFFPPGAAQPAVTLTIAHQSLHAAAEMALLNINGQVVQTQQVGSIPVTMQWPGSLGGGAVTIQLQPELAGRENQVTVQGPWALLRMIQRGTVSRRGDTIRVQFVIGGRDVAYSIQVGTVFNPFFLPALSEFSCPTSL